MVTETLRIDGGLQGMQHFYLYCLLVLMFQCDRMASSMHETIYQFCEILSIELDISISFLINTEEKNPCLGVRE